jgi:hypothetical protein
MSRHVLDLEAKGLKVHAGFCTAKKALFAQVYQGENAKPLAAEEFGFFGNEVPATAAPSASAWTNGVLKASSAKRQINNLIVQPKHCGCEGGCLRCELKPINADFQRYFCACLAVLPTSSHTYAVMESSQMLILRNKRAAADAKIAFKMPIPDLRFLSWLIALRPTELGRVAQPV